MSLLKAIQDQLLTTVSSAFIPEGFISDEVLPVVPSVQQTGVLGVMGKGYLRMVNTLKAGRGSYKRVETTSYTTSQYQIIGHGLEDIVTKEDYKNTNTPFDAERDRVMALALALWVEKEKTLADTLGSTGVMTQNTTLSGTNQWSDKANSVPLDDFTTARKGVRDGCGFPPNTAIMDWDVWNMLRYHPQILDSLGYKYNRVGGMTDQELALAIGVKRILVAQSFYNSSVEGHADVIAPIWGKNLILAFIPEKASLYQTSLGYQVRYAQDMPRKIYKYPVYNPAGANAILCEDDYDQFLTNVNAGYLIKDCIA